MKLGVLSDVHGNRHALDAVIADGEAQGVDQWWVLGDLVAIGPAPVATLERMTSLANVSIISGNTDRYTVTGDRPPPHRDAVLADLSLLDLYTAIEGSFAFTRGVLVVNGWLDWLAALPGQVRTTLADGTRVLGVHATPERDHGLGITPHRPDDDLRAVLAGVDADIVIGGHTHQPTDRWIDGIRALNGGSVANPVTDDLRPSYLVIEHHPDAHDVALRRVDYDVDAFLAALERSRHPEQEHIASFVRGEQFQHPAIRPGAAVARPD